MSKEVILTFGYDIEIPQDVEEQCFESYKGIIDSHGDKDAMYAHIVYTHLVLGRDFVEGVGSISDLGIKISARTPEAEVDGIQVI